MGVPGAPADDVPVVLADAHVVVDACPVGVGAPVEHAGDGVDGGGERYTPVQAPGVEPGVAVLLGFGDGPADVALIGATGPGVGGDETLGAELGERGFEAGEEVLADDGVVLDDEMPVRGRVVQFPRCTSGGPPSLRIR